MRAVTMCSSAPALALLPVLAQAPSIEGVPSHRSPLSPHRAQNAGTPWRDVRSGVFQAGSRVLLALALVGLAAPARAWDWTYRAEPVRVSGISGPASLNQLDQADVILVGVSRCGKTPTSLYLAMQYAIKAANFPLTPDDFERGTLPSTITPHRAKLFGLSIQPERLAEVRNERRPNSRYAQLEQCRYEVAEAERMMRREGISWLSSTTKSIEEIATTVLQEVGLDRG